MTPGWNPSTREPLKERSPQCINAAAARSILPDYLMRTRWVLAGSRWPTCWPAPRRAVAAKKITAPEPGSISYMLSKKQYVADATHNWHPHVMFFLPPVDATTMGAQRSGSPVYGATSDVGPVTTVLVVSPVWSDGSPGPAHN